ncbi:MAG: uroporphyrinogen decarboxylase [Bacteroidetes bacterium]|nr:uroporphyrinogen decarboxylase [Bacteroidota bacterium]
MSEHLFLKACRNEKTERTPVWVMRQAGRYLPEYRAVRARHDFLTMCKTPELAAEITVQPIDIIGFDAAIIFSDILVVPEAMGLSLKIVESNGPAFDNPVKSGGDIDRLNTNVAGKLEYVYEAVRLTKKLLNGRVPLIGFAGAPFTLAAYMVEGKGSKNFEKIKTLIFKEPALAHKLLEKITASVIEYLKGKIDAECDAIQIFDSWAGVLPPDCYEEFSLNYINRIVSEIKRDKLPVIVFPRGIRNFEIMKSSPCDVVGVDWESDLAKIKDTLGGIKVLQGNMDPVILLSDEKKIRSEAGKVLDKMGRDGGHVFNLGHGILPETPIDNIKALVKFIKEESNKYH